MLQITSFYHQCLNLDSLVSLTKPEQPSTRDLPKLCVQELIASAEKAANRAHNKDTDTSVALEEKVRRSLWGSYIKCAYHMYSHCQTANSCIVTFVRSICVQGCKDADVDK